jgi:hypothetical protein
MPQFDVHYNVQTLLCRDKIPFALHVAWNKFGIICMNIWTEPSTKEQKNDRIDIQANSYATQCHNSFTPFRLKASKLYS